MSAAQPAAISYGADPRVESCGLERLQANDDVAIANHLRTCGTCQARVLASPSFANRIAVATRPGARDWKEQRRYARIPLDQPASIRLLGPTISRRAAVARVIQASREGLRLRVSEFVHPGSTIQVHIADTLVFGEVRYCQPAGSNFNIGIQIRDSFPAPLAGSVDSKRKEVRTPVDAVARLRVAGTEALQVVAVLDVSQSGLRIRCRVAFEVGTRLELLYRDATISGEVRYAREVGPDEFNMGISVDAVIREGRAETDLAGAFGL